MMDFHYQANKLEETVNFNLNKNGSDGELI